MKKITCIAVLLAFVSGIAFAALIDDQKGAFLNKERNIAQKFQDLRAEVNGAVQQWNSLGFVSGGANEIIQADIDATQYAGLTVAEVTAIVTTLNAFETWIDAGHDDNLQKILP